uniref:ABC transporter TMD0 domain-containing protein n=1 Tax=Clastoptera arizonana TaxID=38151 RepID=A0A1B6DLV8_9HEMI
MFLETLDEFCGSKFWDLNTTWYTDQPELTPCFEKTVLVWAPSIVLLIALPIEIYYIWSSKDKNIPWNWLNISKVVSIHKFQLFIHKNFINKVGEILILEN